MRILCNIHILKDDENKGVFELNTKTNKISIKPENTYNMYICIPELNINIDNVKNKDIYIDDVIDDEGNLNKIIYKKIIGLQYKSSSTEEKIIASTDSLFEFNIPNSFIKHYITEYNKGNILKNIELELLLFWNNKKHNKQPFPDEYATEKDRVYDLRINDENEIYILN